MLKSKQKWLMILLAVLLVWAMAGCGSKTETNGGLNNGTEKSGASSGGSSGQAGSGEAENVKIGVALAVTGPLGKTGSWTLDGHKLAIKEINESGGFKVGDNTYKIEMIHYDTEGKAESATAAAERLINQDKVVAILGTSISSETAAMIPIADRAKTPLVTMVAASDILTAQGAKFFTQAAPANINYVDAGTKTALEMDMNNIAFIYIDDAWGQSYAKLYPPKLEQAGIKIVATEAFAPEQNEFVTLLNKVKSSNPDGILLAAETEKAIPLLKQLHEIMPDVKILEAGGTIPEEVVRLDPAIAEGLVAMSRTGEETPEIQKFKENFKKEFGYEANSFNYSGYDGIYLLVDAFKRAGTVTDKEKINEAIRASNFKGLIGTYTFNENGGNNLVGNRAIVKDGKVIYQSVESPLPK